MCVNKFVALGAAVAWAAFSTVSLAQPASTDLGTLSSGVTSSGTITLSTQGQIQWYRFTLPAPVSAPSTFLDIRTTSTLPTPANVDTQIALYGPTGNRIGTFDDDDGPGQFSALSFGAVCAVRPNTDPPLGDGAPFDGRDGSTLPAGTYYLAVTGFGGTSFGATNWSVTSSHTQTGSVTSEVTYGAAAPAPAVITATSATPSPVAAGQSTLFTASLQANCPSGLLGASVSVDLSPIGGPAGAPLFDDGTHGDAVAGNNVWSLSYAIPPATPPGPYTLTVTSMNSNGLSSSATIPLTVLTGPAVLTAVGGVYTEVEDNDTKPRANIITAMASGQAISGTTTGTSTVTPGSSSADYFRIATAQAPLGIYRYQLVLTSSTPGHTGTIRGLAQANGVISGSTDVPFQTTSTVTSPPRMNAWYGFGKGENIYYRVTGSVATTAPYTATLAATPVTPASLGAFAPGPITISTVGRGYSTDTDLWVYDSAFNPLPDGGNDDEPSPGSSSQSLLTRTFAAGTYYLALSDWNLANNLPSPPLDRFRGANVLDFPNAIADSSEALVSNLSFTITDSGGQHLVAASKPGPYGIYWATFTIGTAVTCETADFNGDGDVGTDQDIEAFFACLAGNCCPTCETADFNGDGDVGTDSDIEAFFRVLAGGNC